MNHTLKLLTLAPAVHQVRTAEEAERAAARGCEAVEVDVSAGVAELRETVARLGRELTVGAGGVLSSERAFEAVDAGVSQVLAALERKGGTALITADHGNADHMFDVASDGSKHPFTAHTTNRVPFIIVDEKAKLTGIEDGRLSDIAPTMLTMAGIEPSAEMTGRVLATEA